MEGNNHSRGARSDTTDRAPQRAVSSDFTPTVCILFHIFKKEIAANGQPYIFQTEVAANHPIT